jgi:hypothetical protein
MDIQLQVSLLNSIEYIEDLTGYEFDYIAKKILGISEDLLRKIKKLR